jgi:hypothetical protein
LFGGTDLETAREVGEHDDAVARHETKEDGVKPSHPSLKWPSSSAALTKGVEDLNQITQIVNLFDLLDPLMQTGIDLSNQLVSGRVERQDRTNSNRHGDRGR